jgi:hypothetical protein
VLAVDAAGNQGPPTSVSATIVSGDTAAPTAPANLTVTNTRVGRASLKWTVSTDNVSVTAYRVYRDGTLIKTLTKNSYNDNVAAGSHSWYVKAVDAAGNVSLSSNVVSLTTR